MAREFNGSTQYLEHGAPVITAVPATFAAWFRPNTSSGTHAILCSGGDNAGQAYEFGIVQVNAQFWAFAQDSGFNQALAAVTLAGGTLYHGCGVFVSNTSRHAYINGGNKGSDNASRTPTAGFFQRTRIGRRANNSNAQFFDGLVAEAALWNAALSDEEVLYLAQGFSPLLLRSRLNNLVAYWPLLAASGGDEPDMAWGNKYSMSLVAAPTGVAHPPLFRPTFFDPALLGLFSGPGPGPSFQPRPGASMLSGVPMV